MTVNRTQTLKILQTTKNIGFAAGICFLINGMTGPGLPQIPLTFQVAGWILPMICFGIFSIVSGLSVLFIMEAMQKIPGNKHFQGCVEYATLFNFYFDPKMHIFSQFLLYGALISNAVQSIVLVAQSFDQMFVDIFHSTWGLTIGFQSDLRVLNGTNVMTSATTHIADVGAASPFDGTMLLTAGLLMTFLVMIPFLFVDLDNNIKAQIVFFILTVAIVFLWVGLSILNITRIQGDIPSVLAQNLPPSKSADSVLNRFSAISTVMGTVLLNLAFTQVVPSWVNLKKANVSPQNTVMISVAVAVVLYLLSGILPALAYAPNSNAATILPSFTAGPIPILGKISSYAYTLVMLLPGIPVLFMVAYENLTQNEVCSNAIAVFLCFVLPWLMVIPFQTGAVLMTLQLWTSALFVSSANFILPFVVYLQCLKFREQYDSQRDATDKQRLTPTQYKLLRKIHQHSSKIQKYLDDSEKALHMIQPGDFGPEQIPEGDDEMLKSFERGITFSDHSPRVSNAEATDRLMPPFTESDSQFSTMQHEHEHLAIPPISIAPASPVDSVAKTPSPLHSPSAMRAPSPLRTPSPMRTPSPARTPSPGRAPSPLGTPPSILRPQRGLPDDLKKPASMEFLSVESFLDANEDPSTATLQAHVRRKTLNIPRNFTLTGPKRQSKMSSTGPKSPEPSKDDGQPLLKADEEPSEAHEMVQIDPQETAPEPDTLQDISEGAGKRIGRSFLSPLRGKEPTALTNSYIRRTTLPRDVGYRSAFFRTLPHWWPLSPHITAILFLVFCIIMWIINLIAVIIQTVSPPSN
ncbi:uncharacterized protein BJ171DRAFT_507543 [Polychytrium aggregatum]|uniref:uncharacterized protein n=1 Tax=Polychytrium aggregatum TaxID=110093 RepID=UPI0022FF37B5|nr:uncharacterized protein BJ171DRAFT_507543 [Polychytrium aggregatum]KAI9204056.1 hypothetical protein BJ171DRAFT_507543 [Polychytrium aggregatum]